MPPTINHRNRVISVDQTLVLENALSTTHLSATIAASSGTLTVKDIGGFAVGRYVWINPFQPNSEIIAVHASTTPTGNTITLASNTTYAHGAGERVSYIEWDGVEINHAATLSGSKSVLSTELLVARDKELTYLDTSQTTGFYFARFDDSVGSLNSSFSDGVAYDGWATNTVGYMIDRALRDLKVDLSEIVTLQDCLDWVNEGMRDIQGKLKKWPDHMVHNQIIGQTARGSFIQSMPTNIYDSETRRSISAVRVGDGKELIPLDADEFDAFMEDVKYTQVRTEASATDTTLEIDNSYDYADSGTVYVYISGTQYDITYTGVTRSATAGVLTGVPASGDGSISVTIPVDTYVWQDEEEGIPTHYTVRNGQLEAWPLPDATEDNQNVYMDYATVATAVDSQIDEIDYQRYDIILAYLEWKMWSVAKNDSVFDTRSPHYTSYKDRLNDAIRTLPHVKNKWSYGTNTMSRGKSRRTDLQNLSIDEQ